MARLTVAHDRTGQRGKTLVVAPAWVGDMVMAHSIVPGLARRGDEVHFLAPPATASLCGRMAGVAVTHRIDVQHGELALRKRYRMARGLRSVGFRKAIVLPNSFKSALPPFLANISERTGFRGELRYGLLTDMREPNAERWPRLVDGFAALAGVDAAWPRLRVDAAARRRLVARLRLNVDKPVVALCPGAEYGAAKRWPAGHFAALARLSTAAGATVWLLGGANEEAIGRKVAGCATVVNLIGETSLVDVIDLLSLASGVVSNDSGLMHVAAALDRPLVALYGSTTPKRTPPLASRVAIVEDELPCRPCFRRECPLAHLNCLRGIEPQRVFAELCRLIGLQRPSARADMAAALPRSRHGEAAS